MGDLYESRIRLSLHLLPDHQSRRLVCPFLFPEPMIWKGPRKDRRIRSRKNATRGSTAVPRFHRPG